MSTTIITNTPRPGETEALSRTTPEGREALRADPGISALHLTEKQITSLLDNMSDSVVHELTQLRDEIDDTIRTFQDHKRQIIALVAGHTATGDSANQVKSVVADAMRELQSRLADEGAEITKLVNNGRKNSSHA